MTFYEETACIKSHKQLLETCIDGNACKENAADERWVRIFTNAVLIKIYTKIMLLY